MDKIALEILDMNEGSLLSGSLALLSTERKLRRNPVDIDILINPNVPLRMPERARRRYNYPPYEQGDFDMCEWTVDNIKVNTFIPSDQYWPEIQSVYLSGRIVNAVLYTEILRFKSNHALSGSGDPIKHKLDLIYFYENNK